MMLGTDTEDLIRRRAVEADLAGIAERGRRRRAAEAEEAAASLRAEYGTPEREQEPS